MPKRMGSFIPYTRRNWVIGGGEPRSWAEEEAARRRAGSGGRRAEASASVSMPERIAVLDLWVGITGIPLDERQRQLFLSSPALLPLTRQQRVLGRRALRRAGAEVVDGTGRLKLEDWLAEVRRQARSRPPRRWPP